MTGESMGMTGQRYRRRPDIVWREEEEARQDAVEALGRGEDATDEGTLIIVDGGAIFELNLLGADVWKLLEDERSAGEIARDLLDVYDVTEGELTADIDEFLRDLVERGWVEKA
jgi:pyrroloquinoline quinone biosynthesis protein D